MSDTTGAPYYVVEPECPGHLGDETEIDVTSTPVRVTSRTAHIEFDGWLGDDLLSTHPIFLGTMRLAQALESSFSGLVSVRKDVKITTSAEFLEFFPDVQLPPLLRLEFSGTAFTDDVGLTPKGELVVSAKALAWLRQFRIDQAVVQRRPTGGLEK